MRTIESSNSIISLEGKRKAAEALQAAARAELEKDCHKFATIGNERKARAVGKAA